MAAGAIMLGCWTACGVSERKATFVGAALCVSCHEGAGTAWTGSHHDMAMREVTDATVRGDFSNTSFTYAGVTSTFSRDGDRFIVRTDGPTGALQDFAIAYTLGVYPLQQYLVDVGSGKYQVLSIAWDTRSLPEGGQRWFHLYPEEAVTSDDVLHWTSASQNWNSRCALCHSTNLKKRFDSGTGTYNTGWTDINVACEACHGPGSEHLAWVQEAGAGPYDAGDDKGLTTTHTISRSGWSIDPATGNARPQAPSRSHGEIETCAPCHSRRAQIDTAYVHGGPFLDAFLPQLIREGYYFADGQIDDEVYVYGSFLQSKMYKAGVTCSDCHDPHTLKTRADGNALCSSCHLASKYDTIEHHRHEPESTGAHCVSCHMPVRTYMVVDPRRDHSIRVPRPDLSVASGTPNACSQCHTDRPPSWAAVHVLNWSSDSAPFHYGEALLAARQGDRDGDVPLVRVSDDTTMPNIIRATAMDALGAYSGNAAISALQRGIEDDDPLVRLGAAGALAGVETTLAVRMAAPLLTDSLRAVRIQAAQALAGARNGLAGSTGVAMLDSALSEYVASQQIHADRPESFVNLGALYARLGRRDDAEAAYQAAIRVGAYFIPAYVNLADLYRQQNREGDAERVLRAALARGGDMATVHHALGLALVRQQRLDEAIRSLRNAAELEPSNLRFNYVFGVALNSNGDQAGALEVYERVYDAYPTDLDLLLALATTYRDAGKTGEALRYARELAGLVPNNPNVQQLVRQLTSPPRN